MIKGGCLCGAIEFETESGPEAVSMCHCRQCQFARGAVDGPTGLTLEKHIFVAEKGDYYQIADGLPQEQ